jgi:hypothetical protein
VPEDEDLVLVQLAPDPLDHLLDIGDHPLAVRVGATVARSLRRSAFPAAR